MIHETQGCYDMFPYTSHIESLGIFLRQREPADLSKDVQASAETAGLDAAPVASDEVSQ